ncbi:MAG TPA: response regulator [Phycisphaerae bacterium]|nr:response regulator [Phycisphaerae bacterium]
MKDGKHVILYAEDDRDFLDSVRLILEANGYLMVEAATGEEALKVYKQTHPDFILVDLMMEEVDAGTSLVRELKAAGCTAPIYMLSSVGDAMSLSTDTTDLGLSGVLQKPLEPNALLNILKTKLK